MLLQGLTLTCVNPNLCILTLPRGKVSVRFRPFLTGVGAKKPEALWTSVFAGFWSIARSAVEIVTATWSACRPRQLGDE